MTKKKSSLKKVGEFLFTKPRKYFLIGTLLFVLIAISLLIWQAKFQADTTITVTNPGFELTPDLTPWTVTAGGGNIVTDVKHTGAKSLKMTIADSPDTQVFATAYNHISYPTSGLPVKASAYVKTSLLCKEKMGAYISLAYENSSKQIIGEDGAYGTRAFSDTYDWQLVEAELLHNPPAETAYVRIGLHVTGGCTGQDGLTAWFDDVNLIAVGGNKLEVILKNPNYRETLYLDDQDIDYSTDFPHRKTILVTATINNPENSPLTHAINAKLKKSSGEQIDEKSLGGVKANDGLKNIALYMNEPTIGDFKVEVTLDGGQLKTLPFKINVGTNPTVKKGTFFDANNRAIVNGNPFFPLGFYMEGITFGSAGDKFKDIDKIKASGFNTVLDYSYAGCNYQVVKEIRGGCLANGAPSQAGVNTFFNEAESRGLKVVLTISRFLEGDAPWSFQKANPNTEVVAGSAGLKEVVNQFKDEESLLAWYTNDEMSNWYLNQLKSDYNWMKSDDGDKNHPVYQVVTQNQPAKRHRSSLDVLGVDKYPNFCTPLTDVVCKKYYDLSNIQAIASTSETARTNALDAKPVWMVLSANTKVNLQKKMDDEGSYATAVPPNYEQVVNMSYQAIAKGARGLFFWQARNVSIDGQSQWVNMSRAGHHLESIKQVALGIDLPTNQSIQVKNSDGSANNNILTLTRKGTDGEYYLLAVNLKEDGSSTGKFVLPSGLEPYKKIANMTPNCPAQADPENLNITCANSSEVMTYSASSRSFSDDLEPLGVRIYKLESDSGPVTPPVITIVSPANGTVTLNNSITVSYKVDGANKTKTFRNLKLGENNLKVTAASPIDPSVISTKTVLVIYKEPVVLPPGEYAKGWNMVSFPDLVSGITNESLPNSYLLREYNNESNNYNKGEVSAITLTPGIGYWMKIDNTKKIANLKYAKEAKNEIETGVRQGWNLLGNPYTSDLPLSNLAVKYKDGSTKTFSEAVSDKDVAGYGWSWENTADPKQYYFIAINPDNYETSAQKKTSVAPYHGFWIIVKSDQISNIFIKR